MSPTRNLRSDDATERTDVLTPVFGSDRDDGRNVRPHPQWTLWDAIKTFSLRNFVFALILGVIAAAGGAAIAMKQSAVYSGKATLIIDQPKVLAESKDEGAILKIAFLKIKYADLAKGPAISGAAAQSVGLTEKRVSDAVTVTTSGQNLLLDVTAQASTSPQAVRIANAVGQSIADYADGEQQAINVPQSDRYRFSFVQRAVTATQIRPTTNRALQAAVGLGVIGVAFAYVILQLLTASMRLR